MKIASLIRTLSVVLAASMISLGAEANWQLVSGSAMDISAGPDGSVWVVSNRSVAGGFEIYTYEGPDRWRRVPGGAVRIDVGPKNQVWLVNDAGNIYRSNAQGWEKLPGLATDIGVGADGTVWVIGTNKVPGGFGIYRWVGNDWQLVPGGAVRIDVDPKGAAWIVNDAGTIYSLVEQNWQKMPGAAIDVGIGAEGSTFVTGTNQGIYRWNGKDWAPTPGSATQVTVDSRGRPWVVNAKNEIFAWGDAKGVVPAQVATVPLAAPVPAVSKVVDSRQMIERLVAAPAIELTPIQQIQMNMNKFGGPYTLEVGDTLTFQWISSIGAMTVIGGGGGADYLQTVSYSPQLGGGYESPKMVAGAATFKALKPGQINFTLQMAHFGSNRGVGAGVYIMPAVPAASRYRWNYMGGTITKNPGQNTSSGTITMRVGDYIRFDSGFPIGRLCTYHSANPQAGIITLAHVGAHLGNDFTKFDTAYFKAMKAGTEKLQVNAQPCDSRGTFSGQAGLFNTINVVVN